MFFKELKWDLVCFLAILLHQQGAIGFFVKHVKTGKCIDDSGIVQSRGDWGHLTFLEFSDNCLNKTAQFRFRDNGALLNLEADGCFAAYAKAGHDPNYFRLPFMFYIYVDAVSKDRSACAQKPKKNIYRAITQTPDGALSVYTKPYEHWRFETWCAEPESRSDVSSMGIDLYLGLKNPCYGAEDNRFNFGSVTCYGMIVNNTNCPKDQYMVVKTASYRGLSATKTCGMSDDYGCEIDATCVVKKQCDGKHECKITVDDNLFSGDPCPGWTKYLYFEYQCIDTATSFHESCVQSVSLSSSQLPNKGFLTVSIDNEENIVCSSAPNTNTMNVVCRQLGYGKTQRNSPVVSSSILKKFSGSIYCNGDETTLSQCVTMNGATGTCSEQLFVTCTICDNPLLEYTDYFRDSSFKAPASISGHHASMARISSGGSWCAPNSGRNHYLEVDLRGRFVITNVATFGDSATGKWVTSYYLNYTVDMIHWKQASTGYQKIFRGSKNAYNYAAIRQVDGGITARVVRFIPLNSVAQACMRVQLCGKCKGPFLYSGGGECDTVIIQPFCTKCWYTAILPVGPFNLTVVKIKPHSAELSWSDSPIKTTGEPVTRFWIKLKHNGKILVQRKHSYYGENKYLINDLTPFTKYEVSVGFGNRNDFGEPTSIMFTSGEDVPNGPPLNITVVGKSSSSLLVTWNQPEISKRNGIIVNYTVCISRQEIEPCFKEYTTSEKMLVIGSLKVSTKYYVRVLASTKIGRGLYSNSTKKFTYAEPVEKAINETKSTLTFYLHKPVENFTYFYVLALKLPDGETPKPPDSYQNADLMTYGDARMADAKVYIASVFTSSFVGKYMFVLGDGTSTSNPSMARRRRSTTNHYYNGPLEPDTSYTISQRIFVGKDEYYSTDWSPTSKTSPSAVTEASSDGNNIGTIVGAVVGILLVLIIITVLAVIIYKRRTLNIGGSRETDKIYDLPDCQTGRITNVAYEPNGNQTTDEDLNHRNGTMSENEKANSCADNPVYGNQETIVGRSHLPIPVAEFDGYLSRMKEIKNKELKLDFEDLPTGQTLNWSIAKRPFNIPKNRFGNAVTYDHSRVVLSGNEKKDYINATFIDGVTEKYYIATQGPKPKTVNDFWRMIFEYQCPTIVMLTTLKEMGKVKCEKYWPDESHTYGEIKVTVTQSRAFADYVTRTFLVEKDDQQLEVQHLHFVSWPDFGVPLYPTQILTFRGQFRSFHETKTGPAVIHCSAGVGRTGVFIAVDKMLDDLDKEKKDTIDVFGFVQEMRTRRVNMVQTLEQYVFIHDTILDHIKCGVNEIEAGQIIIEIRQLSEKNKNGKTGFEEKFQRLKGVSPKLAKEQCEAALLPGNRNKNRKADIYPSESGRVYLKPLAQVENSDYINACFVDGYLGRNYFIATQTPTDGTIDDFWRMVLQHKSSTIVVLNQLREEGEEYPLFWPTERAKPRSFGATTVMVDSFVKNDDIVVRKFIVSPSASIKDGRMIRMIHYMSWPDHGVPKNVDDIVKILSEVEDSQRAVEGKKGPVIVMCSDGAGRSGTYIAISNLVDRMKVLQVVDVFQCIKLIRGKRPQFVETVAQFKLCYLAITSVLESFNEYSNFKITNGCK